MTKILIVDDDKERSALIREFFTENLCQVDSALNGLDAFYHCQKKHYGLIIINENLPDISGKIITANILKNKRDSVVIMMTEKKKLSLRIFCKKRQITLVKIPIDTKKLSEILRKREQQEKMEVW